MTKSFETISIVGLGYIGLPTAALFATHGIKVIGIDVNLHAINTINRGKIHIVEPDLERMVHSTVAAGFLHATTRPEAADAFLIAVPTPFMCDSNDAHKPDLSYIKAACKSIAPVLKAGDLVILESTSPVGATEQMSAWLEEERPDLTFPLSYGESSDIRIAYCPERVLPGNVLRELIHNDRVIGGITSKCSELAAQLYKIFVKGECIITNSRTAEMCKLTENSFRDVNIAFANELSIICAKHGIDVWELINLANHHPRVKILQPGPGVGGHCIAVDPWFIVSASPNEARLIKTAREVNDNKPEWLINNVKIEIANFLLEHPEMNSSDVWIACFGLSFKADIDDLRESPSAAIARNLAISMPGRVMAVEPNISKIPPEWNSSLHLTSIDEALDKAQIIVILVDHKEFKILPKSAFLGKRCIDSRGLLSSSLH